VGFSEVFVDEVRRAADVVRVISDHVGLKRVGTSWKGLCPFHQEKSPSFNVRSDPPVFHCFGCGEGGDVFKFVMLRERCSFPEAVEALARRFGVPVPESSRDAAPERLAREQVLAALEAAALHYSRRLWSPAGTAAREYLLSRGFAQSTLERIRAGAALDEWEDLSAALGKTFPNEVLLNAGLVLPGKDGRRPYDRFRNRAMFPIVGEAGKVVAFGARSLDGSEPKYLNSPETVAYQKGRTLYGLYWAKDAVRRTGHIVLMEGYLDVARAMECEIGEAVATCGTALTPSHARLVRRFAERVILNFDQDEAGQNAARKSYDALSGEGLQIHVVTLPPGHDPDSFLKAHGAEAYRERLVAAPAFVEWMIARSAARHDLRTPQGQAAYARELLPVLVRVDSAVERAAWVKRAAAHAGIDHGAFEQELKRTRAGGAQRAPAPPPPAPVPARRVKLLPAETWLLVMVLRGDEGIEEALEELDELDVAELPSAEIWAAAKALLRRGAGLDAAALVGAIEDDGLRRLLSELAIAAPPTGDATPLDCVREIKCWPLEARCAEIRRALSSAAPEQVDALLGEQLELKQRLAGLARAAPALR
jgi:DNA primase